MPDHSNKAVAIFDPSWSLSAAQATLAVLAEFTPESSPGYDWERVGLIGHEGKIHRAGPRIGTNFRPLAGIFIQTAGPAENSGPTLSIPGYGAPNGTDAHEEL